jgi:glycine/D-amino acid oxidase-like deaminating enzyme
VAIVGARAAGAATALLLARHGLGELTGYLRRAGCPSAPAVCVTGEVPGPWAAALAGRWREAAADWRSLGERYEEAVELALSDDDRGPGQSSVNGS